MQHTYNFPLSCAKLIKEFALSYTKDAITDNVYVFDIKNEKSIFEVLNSELEALSLPKVFNIVIFKRKNCRITSAVHIDSTSYDLEPIHASIVVPVEGYRDTVMYWMSGEYKEQVSFTDNRIAFKKIVWIGVPKLDAIKEIVDTTLCRVDLPHSATSNLDGSYRTIVSIRLQGNPTVDEIIEKLNQA